MTHNELIQQLQYIENHLSPENLHCDGEASMAYVRREEARLNKHRAKIIAQLGYEPSYKELWG